MFSPIRRLGEYILPRHLHEHFALGYPHNIMERINGAIVDMRLPRESPSGGIVPAGEYHVNGIRLARKLGHGSFARVYEGIPTDSDQIAVKVAFSGDRFLPREIAVHTALSEQGSARIVTAYDHGIGLIDGYQERPFLIMEMMPYGSAGDVVSREGAIQPERVSEITTHLAEGLSVVHGEGLFHSDLKPENVLLGPDGAKLSDFGLTRPFDAPIDANIESDDAAATGAHALAGSPSYMAPEQAHGRGEPGTDVTALSLTAMKLLLGEPFRANNNAYYVIESLRDSRRYEDGVRAGIQMLTDADYPELKSLMMRATHMDIDQRPDALGFAQDLGSRLAERTSRQRAVAQTIFTAK